MSRPSLLPLRFDPRLERRASAARAAAAARSDDWGRPHALGAGAAVGVGWGPRMGAGGVRVGDDRPWAHVELQAQPDAPVPPVLYSYFASPEQELPGHVDAADVFSPQWWVGAEYGERDYLFPGPAHERSASGAWLWDEAAGDAAMAPAADPYDAVELNVSDESEAEDEEQDEEEEDDPEDEERQSMFRVERDGPPRPKAPAAAPRTDADGADAAALMRRAMSSPPRPSLRARPGRILDAGDPPLALRRGRGPAPSSSNAAATTTPPATAAPPAATASDWTLRPKAERPEEEEDFIRCQQLSRCSDRPPCPGCLCFLCPGCSGPLNSAGGEGDAEESAPSPSPSSGVSVGGSSLPGPAPAPTTSPVAATASTPTATSAPAPAPTPAPGALPRPSPGPGAASRKALWGPCRAVTSTRAF